MIQEFISIKAPKEYVNCITAVCIWFQEHESGSHSTGIRMFNDIDSIDLYCRRIMTFYLQVLRYRWLGFDLGTVCLGIGDFTSSVLQG